MDGNLASVVENWPTILFQQSFSIHESVCSVCGTASPVNNYFVTPAGVLFVEFSTQVCNFVHMHEVIFLFGIKYALKGVVRNTGAHFTVAVQTDHGWAYIDDLKKQTIFFDSFTDLKCENQHGWFFCCFVLEESTLGISANTNLYSMDNIDCVPSSLSLQQEKALVHSTFDHDYCTP